MSDDFGGGYWWEIIPPPPDEEPDDEGTFLADEGEPELDSFTTPEPGEFLDAGQWEITLGISEQIVDVFDFMLSPENFDPSQVRGVGFFDPGEALNWLEQIGLLGISAITQIGDLYYPVIGTYEDVDDDEPDEPDLPDFIDFPPIEFNPY